MTDIESWRFALDPPPGGLARLARSIERRSVRPPRPHLRLAAAGTAAAALLCVLGLEHYRHEAPRRAFEQRLRTALEAERRESGIARELPSGRADVRIVVLAGPPPAPDSRNP